MGDIKSILKMERLVFDKISFSRLGFKNDNQLTYSLQAKFAKSIDDSTYRVTLVLTGNKKDEYKVEISLTGFFSLDSPEEIEKEVENDLIGKNTLAIMMPYLRSQISLLTAQPGVDCVLLPPFNVNAMIEEQR